MITKFTHLHFLALLLFLSGCGNSELSEEINKKTVDAVKDEPRAATADEVKTFEGTPQQFSKEFAVREGKLYSLVPYSGEVKILNDNALLISHDRYVSGKLDGVSTKWWADTGKKKLEWIYQSGTPTGKKLEWYQDGARKLEQNFKEGKPDGKEISWYPNGKTKYEHSFENGQPHGVWTDWGENGATIRSLRYDQGKVVEQIYPK